MGVLGKIAEAVGIREKCTTLQTVVVKVKVDCEGCEKKVYRVLKSMEGAHTVIVDRKGQRAEVTGYVDAEEVVRKLKASGKKAEIWPYVPANLVPHPYAPGVYDRRAPSDWVRNSNATYVSGPVYQQSQAISAAFSDDNPNACSIM